MLSIYILILVISLTVIFLFSSPTLSPIPYFPSNKKDLPKIIKALDLKNNQTVFDLGAGDGIIIFQAAKEAWKRKLNTRFIAVEINPILILILLLRRLFHPNRKNIKIVCDDIFKTNFPQSTMKQWNNVTIYLYISPWYLEKTLSNIKNQSAGWRTKFSVISYMYQVQSLKQEKIIHGKNKIFVYNVFNE
jgi:SAM-dependent methyltransferase